MSEITSQQLQEKFDSLPEDLKLVLVSADIDDKIIEIGKKNALTVEQIGNLSLQTHLAIFGFTKHDKFQKSIQKSLDLSDEKASLITGDINDQILKDIREKQMALSVSLSVLPEEQPVVNKEQQIIEQQIIENTKESIKDEEKQFGKQTQETQETIREFNKIKLVNFSKERLSSNQGVANNDRLGQTQIKDNTDLNLTSSNDLNNKKTSGDKNEDVLGSVTAKKLNSFFKDPPKKTEYALNNKNGLKNVLPKSDLFHVVGSSTSKLSPSYSIGNDPYRTKVD